MASQSVIQEAPAVDRDALASAAYKPAFPPAWAVPVAVGTLADALASSRIRAGHPHPREPWRVLQRRDGAETVAPLMYFDRAVARYVSADSHLGRAHARYQVEGPRWFASIAPGRIRFGSVNPTKDNRRHEREDCRRAKRLAEHYGWVRRVELGDALAAAVAGGFRVVDPSQIPDIGPDPLRPGRKGREIMEWSAKSRSNMIDRLSTLDYEPLVAQGVPAMVTLTLPGDWEAYAPTGGRFKLLVRAFQKRYERAWDRRLIGLWKLEFQRRGAPHLHALIVPPAGQVNGLPWRDWFAQTWASVVVSSVKGLPAHRRDEDYHAMVRVHRHPTASADYAEGLRASDPRRVAVYFLKHSLLHDKEYQHIVPAAWRGEGDGPGRFWGYWALERADLAVPLTYDEAVAMARTLRRWQASKGATRRVSIPAVRVDETTGEVRTRYRSVRRRVKPLRRTAGYVVLNDGPAAALLLADFMRAYHHDRQRKSDTETMIDRPFRA